MPKSPVPLDSGGPGADHRGMGFVAGAPAARLLGAALAVVALLPGLGSCTQDPPGVSAPASSPAPSSIPVTAPEPRADGPFAVRLGVGLAAVTADRCDPTDPRRVCSVDRSRTWAPLGSPTAATVTGVRTHLADQHTSWTTRIRFADADRPALRRAAKQANGMGGVVLVLDADRRVLAAVPGSTIRNTTAVLTGLDKPTAWALVEGFAPG